MVSSVVGRRGNMDDELKEIIVTKNQSSKLRLLIRSDIDNVSWEVCWADAILLWHRFCWLADCIDLWLGGLCVLSASSVLAALKPCT